MSEKIPAAFFETKEYKNALKEMAAASEERRIEVLNETHNRVHCPDCCADLEITKDSEGQKALKFIKHNI